MEEVSKDVCVRRLRTTVQEQELTIQALEVVRLRSCIYSLCLISFLLQLVYSVVCFFHRNSLLTRITALNF